MNLFWNKYWYLKAIPLCALSPFVSATDNLNCNTHCISTSLLMVRTKILYRCCVVVLQHLKTIQKLTSEIQLKSSWIDTQGQFKLFNFSRKFLPETAMNIGSSLLHFRASCQEVAFSNTYNTELNQIHKPKSTQMDSMQLTLWICTVDINSFQKCSPRRNKIRNLLKAVTNAL